MNGIGLHNGLEALKGGQDKPTLVSLMPELLVLTSTASISR